MKAIFYLPAHPSYFNDEYTQEEIDKAIEQYNELTGGKIFNGNPSPKVKQEFRLLRQSGKSVTVIFDTVGIGDATEVSDERKSHAVDQYRATSNRDLRTHVQNLKNLMEGNRGNFQGGGRIITP